MRYVVRPLTPEAINRMKSHRPTGSPFRAPWAQTMDLLDRELHALGAREFVMLIDCTEVDLKLNGDLRASARPSTPRVAVSFTSTKGPLMFACGRFNDWRDNVRAVALGLEALRKVDRYGITQAAEQYRGFQPLPPGSPMPPPSGRMSVEEAARLMLDLADEHVAAVADVLRDPSIASVVYRAAAKRHHPDAGGDAVTFRRLTEARDLVAASSTSSRPDEVDG